MFVRVNFALASVCLIVTMIVLIHIELVPVQQPRITNIQPQIDTVRPSVRLSACMCYQQWLHICNPWVSAGTTFCNPAQALTDRQTETHKQTDTRAYCNRRKPLWFPCRGVVLFCLCSDDGKTEHVNRLTNEHGQRDTRTSIWMDR